MMIKGIVDKHHPVTRHATWAPAVHEKCNMEEDVADAPSPTDSDPHAVCYSMGPSCVAPPNKKMVEP